MSPVPALISNELVPREINKPTNPDGLVLEAWAEGYMVGSLIIMSCITLANMRKGVLLHKLILLELVFGYWQGFFILFNQPVYGWWLSVAAIPLNTSWILHNVISWMKLRPFLSRFWSRVFIGTIMLSTPYWVVEIYANFTYFHNINSVFLRTRPWEALCRDPWWIVAAIVLLYNIKTKYDLGALQIAHISPRFAVMLGAMLLSIAFIILDVLSVTDALKSALPVGINPFWKLSFVFKCLTDSVVLDDFKTALDRLRAFKISRLGSFAMDTNDDRVRDHRETIRNANGWPDGPDVGPPVPIGKLPAMPDQSTDQVPPETREIRSVHVEDGRYAGIVRTASRDRDLEENRIEIPDQTEADRQTSDAQTLGHHHHRRHRHHHHHRHHPWIHQPSPTSSTSDVDYDYAMAVREVTNDSTQSHKGPATVSVAK